MSSPSPIAITLIGSFSALDGNGLPIEIRSKKAQALLAYLAAEPGVRRSRDRLSALLWGDLQQDNARHSLRQCISSLRKAFGERHADIIEVDGDEISVNPSATTVDVCRIRAAAAGTDVEEWQRALDGYHGELLETLVVDELGFEEWVRSERRQLERVVGRLCLQLADAYSDAGELDRAETALHRRLELDPCSEEAHRRLMSLHARAGRRGQAVRQYELCRDTLREQLDAAPSPQTERAYRSLLSDDEQLGDRDPLPLPARPAIAVLPFDNVSGDPDQRYFSDGIAEDIIVALSRFDAIMVIARPSSFSFRDRAVDVREVGRTLGVHYVLQGSVRRSGDVLRVSAQLLDAGTGETVWADAYDRPVAAVFEIQDALVQTIVATLVSRVEVHSAQQLRRKPTDSLEAYECILKGKYHHHRYSPRDNQQAQACLARAIELDPDSAIAHAWLACAIAQSHAFGADASAFERGYESAMRARTLNDGESECHRILAAYYLIRRRYDDCQMHQARALALNPNDDRIVAQNGEILGYLGEPGEAARWLEAAMRLNPFHHDGYFYDYGRALYDDGRFPEAAAAFRRIGAPRPNHLMYMAATEEQLGHRARAAECLADAKRLRPDCDLTSFAAGLPYRDEATCRDLAAVLGRIEAS